MNKKLMVLFGCALWAGSVAAPKAPALPPPPPLPAAKDVPVTWVPALPPPPREPHPDGEALAGAGASGSASDASTSASESDGGKGRKARVKTAGSVRGLTLKAPGSVSDKDLKVLHKRFAATVHRNNALKLDTGYEAKKTKLGFGAPKLNKEAKSALNVAIANFANKTETGRLYGGISASPEHEHAFLTRKIKTMDQAHAKAIGATDHAKADHLAHHAAARKAAREAASKRK